jgi:hypothetical protein
VNLWTLRPGVSSTHTQVDQTSVGLAVELAARLTPAVVDEAVTAKTPRTAQQNEARNLSGGCTCTWHARVSQRLPASSIQDLPRDIRAHWARLKPYRSTQRCAVSGHVTLRHVGG